MKPFGVFILIYKCACPTILSMEPSNVLIDGSSGSTGFTFIRLDLATDSGMHELVHPVSGMHISSLELYGSLSEAC